MSSKQEQQQANDVEKNIEIWKVKKLIKRLESARGNGTSMISLIIRMLLHSRPGFDSSQWLTPEFSTQGSDLSSGKDVG